MKALLSVLIPLALSVPAFAENFSCLRDHEEAGAKRVDSILRDGVLAALKKQGIALKDGSLLSGGSFSYHYEEESTDKWVTHAMLSWEGRAATVSGTELLLFLKQPENEESGNYAFFLPVLKSKGFDREGNPIEPHCSLNVSSPFVSNIAHAVGVRNARSGRVIAIIALPKVVSVY